MKVLFLNTFRNGGASVAARRLGEALIKSGMEVTFGTFYPQDDAKHMIGSGWKNKLAFIKDRLSVWKILKKKSNLYKYSSGIGSNSIFQDRAFLEADIIHLHWVHFGFLGVDQVRRIAQLKPVVWGLHDMWSFTGGCHYGLGCDHYLDSCNSCFYLSNSSKASNRLLAEKKAKWSDVQLNLVASSRWLGDCAQQSSLFRNRTVRSIGIPLDLTVFKPLDRAVVRSEFELSQDAFYVLCGAMDLSDERKGFNYLIQSLKLLKEKIPNLVLLLFGSKAEPVDGLKTVSLGHFSEEADLAKVYNAADVFVLPSLQDNLPNTVLETMACGTPCVSFDEGGMEDMIDHLENGFLATSRNIESLAEGIKMFRDPKIRASASILARDKIARVFSQDVIANKYKAFYSEVLDSFQNQS